jgi:hypothetical protein
VVSGTTSIRSGTRRIALGAHVNGAAPMRGELYSVAIMRGIGGTVVANPDFQSGSGTWVDSAGNTWTEKP